MKYVQQIFLLLLAFGGMSFNSLAQVQFEANVNRTHIGKNERITLQFVVNADGSNFQPPSLENFRVLGGPNKSTSMRIINFERSVENSYSYILMPRKVGNLRIGPASIEVGGQTYRTEPISIQVSEQSPRANDPNDPYARAAEHAFFNIISSKTKVYQGEPFVASYKIYFDTDLGRPQIIEEPQFTGFYKDEVNLNRIDTRTETYNNKQYKTGIISQKVLIPQQTGLIKPGEVTMEIPTQLPSNRTDIFGRRISQTITQTQTEKFPAIRVLPLPEEGKPSSFDGAVGDFDFSVSLSRSSLSADESVTLTVKLTGRGNIKLVDAPRPEIPPAFEVYDPKYSEDIRVGSFGMSGTKTYEYLLIPRYGGTYKIPEIDFSYFDPQLERYNTLSSEEHEVTITGAPARPGKETGVAMGEKEDVDFIGKDILFIKTSSDDFEKIDKSFLGSSLFYSILGLSALTWAGMLGFFVYSNKAGSDQKKKSKRAGKKAQKQLSQARKALERNKHEEFYEALSSALWGYFADKFSIPQSRLSKDHIQDKLLERGVDIETTDKILESLNQAEMARFTAAGSKTPQADYDQAASLLTKIEDTL